MPKAPDTPSRQRSIQSIDVGFKLIKALERAESSLTLKELALRAGMPPSKAHFYLVSFKRVGLVAQNEGNGQYLLGHYALDLGLSALRRLDLVEVAQEAMRTLSSEINESVFLSVWGNRGPTIVFKVDGPRRIPMTLQIGYVLPLLRSATGRVFLTYLPHVLTENSLREETLTLPPKTRNAFDVASLRKRVVDAGLAETDGLLNDGFTGVSAPIRNHQGELAGALTIIGPSEDAIGNIQDNVSRLLDVTRTISRSLGAPG